jgi:hypothetical protein
VLTGWIGQRGALALPSHSAGGSQGGWGRAVGTVEGGDVGGDDLHPPDGVLNGWASGSRLEILEQN